MINYIQNPYRIRVDTSIKVIEKDGSEYSVPVVIIVKMEKLNNKQQVGLHSIVHNIFNKRFVIDKKEKPKSNKDWWKFW
jgi:hypothetical protein